MASYRIRLGGSGGAWLHAMGVVSGLTSSTAYRTDGWSGCHQASWSFAPPTGSRFSSPWFTAGAVVEVFRLGILVWGGILSEPTPNEDGSWTVAANGYGVEAENVYALVAWGAPPTGFASVQTGRIPDDAFDYAVANQGIHLRRFTNSLGGVAMTTAGADPWTLSDLLVAAAKAQGKRWWVGASGEVRMVSDPTTPTVLLTPLGPIFGTADDSTVTALRGWAIETVSGTKGYLPTQSDAQAIASFGRREAVADLTPLGGITSATGVTNLANRFGMLGARTQYTNVINVTALNLYVPGYGAGDPFAIQAGQMVRIPDAWNSGRSPERSPVQDVVLAQVLQVWDEDRAELTPVGFADRSIALAPATAPVDDIAS